MKFWFSTPPAGISARLGPLLVVAIGIISLRAPLGVAAHQERPMIDSASLATAEPTNARQMATAAAAFEKSLSAAQPEVLHAPIDDEVARTNWSNLPAGLAKRWGPRGLTPETFRVSRNSAAWLSSRNARDAA